MQDQVPPFPSETAISIVEEELGAPVGDIFDKFDYEPIAAASLGNLDFILNTAYTDLSNLSGNDISNFLCCRAGPSCKIKGTGCCRESTKAWSQSSF